MWRGCLAALFLSGAAFAQDDLPKVLDDRLKIELIAENPDLVTPTGIDVDHQGRVFVIESNTHFPPDGYQGHPTDRVLVIENPADPKTKKITVFADGLKHAMSVAVKPVWLEFAESGKPEAESQKKSDDHQSAAGSPHSALSIPLHIFIATRNEILLLTDTDGDLKADEKKRLVFLDTKGNYPHNALAGFAFDALGNMFFGLGENMANDYKLIGSDGTTLSGIEAGKLYRCKPDGSKLEQWATGFWNPHASCFDAFGRLFTVDNDPDSRPPCRLLHIIPGGDYGYRFRNGRKGTHPFTSWNGEIPGTLPMVAGTGEAPSGIVCYESDGFPEDYLGTLLVGSWGDHRIDQFVLEPKGASFISKAKPIIKGGENFRPVGLAIAPDGSLYFSDWVLKDYKLHGKGRVWRVCGKDEPKHDSSQLEEVLTSIDSELLRKRLTHKQQVVRRIAAQRLVSSPEQADFCRKILRDDNATSRSRVEILWAISQAPITTFDFRVGSTEDAQDAPFGGRFDEMIVAAVPLAGYGQFPCAERYSKEWYNGRHLINASTLKQVPVHLLCQFRLWETLHEDGRGKLELGNASFESEAEASFSDFDRNDPFQSTALIISESQDASENSLVESMGKTVWLSDHVSFETTDDYRLQAVLATRRLPIDRTNYAVLRLGLTDESLMVRRAAVQWVGEENLKEHRWLVEAILNQPTTTPDLFLACLATLQLLDGKPASEFEKNPPTQYIAAMVTDANRPAALRATALRMLPANAPELTAPLLKELLSSTDESLRMEAIRTLANSPLPEARSLLLPIATDPQVSIELRCEAIAGLCNGPHDKPLPNDIEDFLLRTVRSDNQALQLEALRALRGRATERSNIRKAIQKAGELASDNAALREAIEIALTGKSKPAAQPSTLDSQSGDSLAGRRVFYSHNGPLCAKCHTVQGRGGQVGPDLTVIARTMDREKLLASILEPSKEISPQFTTWVIETTAGKTHTGFIVEDNRTGQIKLGTPAGETIMLNEEEIETREPSKTSVMPEKLHERMTPQELRDLLAFLESLK